MLTENGFSAWIEDSHQVWWVWLTAAARVSTSVFQYDFYSQDVIFLPLDKDIELSFKGIAKPIFLETGLKSWMFFLKTEHKEAILKGHIERLVNILSAFS